MAGLIFLWSEVPAPRVVRVRTDIVEPAILSLDEVEAID